MPREPSRKRTIAFIDGQNLFYAAKWAFAYSYPNYDVHLLARRICELRGWDHVATYFYTGVPDPRIRPSWNHFWNAKMATMATHGVRTYSRRLHYRKQTVRLPGGGTTTTLVGQEKGIDVRIALDIVLMALDNRYDVAVIFSQDQDLSVATEEVRRISIRHNRWIKRACVFPASPTSRNKRGINGTDWIRIDRATYDACLDPNDYRPARKRTGG